MLYIFWAFFSLILITCGNSNYSLAQAVGTSEAGQTISSHSASQAELAEGYIKELKEIMRGKSYPAYEDFIKKKVETNDHKTLDTYFSNLHLAYEQGKIDDIELRYALSTIWSLSDLKYDSFFEEWIKKYPQSYIARIAYASYHYEMAWNIRGEGYSDDISSSVWDMYYKELAVAMKHYQLAVTMSPKPLLAYFGLIGINGETNSRFPNSQDTTELLRLANIVDPQNFWAREQYMRFLYPSWGGSYNQMKRFVADQKIAGLHQDKVNLLDSFIFESYAEDQAYNKNISAAEKLYRQAYKLQQAYKFLYIGQGGARGLIWSKDTKSTDNIYDEEMIVTIDDLLKNSGNLSDAGYYYSLKGHFYVARGLKTKNTEDFKLAFDSFNAGAEHKDAYSTYRLASTYCEGFSGVVEKNVDLCRSLMTQSAEMGSEEAQIVMKTRWGQDIATKPVEQPVYGLTQAGQKIQADEYRLKESDTTAPLWERILYIALQVLI